MAGGTGVRRVRGLSVVSGERTLVREERMHFNNFYPRTSQLITQASYLAFVTVTP